MSGSVGLKDKGSARLFLQPLVECCARSEVRQIDTSDGSSAPDVAGEGDAMTPKRIGEPGPEMVGEQSGC